MIELDTTLGHYCFKARLDTFEKPEMRSVLQKVGAAGYYLNGVKNEIYLSPLVVHYFVGVCAIDGFEPSNKSIADAYQDRIV